jgi:hypothetical protein
VMVDSASGRRIIPDRPGLLDSSMCVDSILSIAQQSAPLADWR